MVYVFFGVDVDIVGVTLWLLFFDTGQRRDRGVIDLFRPSVPHFYCSLVLSEKAIRRQTNVSHDRYVKPTLPKSAQIFNGLDVFE